METTISQQNPRRISIALFASSFVLLTISTLFPRLWFLLFFGLIPLFFATHRLNQKTALYGALIVGFLYNCVVIYPLSTLNTWWWTVSNGLLWQYKNLLYFGVTILLAAICSLITFGVVFLLYIKQLKKFPLVSLFVLPIAWEFLETVRVKLFFNLEWGTLGHDLGNNIFFARSVAFGGTFILSSLVVILNFCLFLFLFSVIERQKISKREFIKKIAVATCVLIGIFVALILNNNFILKNAATEKNTNPRGEISVVIISPNIQTADVNETTGSEHIFTLISEAIKNSPDLILLPENIFPFLVIDEKTELPFNYTQNKTVAKNFDKLTSISKKLPSTTFIVGFHTIKNSSASSTSRYNSAVVLEKGKIVSIYNKQNLLPFTEKSFSFLETIHIDPLSAGSGQKTIHTALGDIRPLICSEILTSQNSFFENFTDSATTSPKNKVFSVNLSNDNIFNSHRVATYNKISAKLQAIELEETLVRSSKGGFSGIFDQTGQEIPLVSEKGGEILFGKI